MVLKKNLFVHLEKNIVENENAIKEEEDKLKNEDGLSMFAERYFLVSLI